MIRLRRILSPKELKDGQHAEMSRKGAPSAEKGEREREKAMRLWSSLELYAKQFEVRDAVPKISTNFSVRLNVKLVRQLRQSYPFGRKLNK
jgi:hypothetical protein